MWFGFETICVFHLKWYVKDVKLRQTFRPTYPIGAKRMLFSDDFYPAVMKPNVTVLEKAKTIQSIDGENGVLRLSNDNEGIKVDEIILATGFITNPFLYGIEGLSAKGKRLWYQDDGISEDDAHAYFGICTHGFPNFFVLYGPNTNTGHTSVILGLEEQASLVVKMLSFLKSNNFQALENQTRCGIGL